VIVHQLLCAAGPVDAVTQQGIAWRRRFESFGFGGQDYAELLVPEMDRSVIRPARHLRPEPNELIVLHYSGYVASLERLLEMPNPLVLVYHNITPPRFFWGYEPVEAVRCAQGSAQLAQLAPRAQLAVGVSEYNACDLRAAGARETTVIPVLFERGRLPEPGPPKPPVGSPTILFVGRLAPHKRQDLLIRAFALYRRHRAPDAQLRLVGVPISPRFENALRRLASEQAPGAVSFESHIPSELVWQRYREADAFLCMSEHEGFCVPLLEAFHFGLPVIARPLAAITEVAGDAALLIDDDSLAVFAEALHLAVGDEALREEVRRRGAARLLAYDADESAVRMRETLERVALAVA
jgi:glycosyltransferase involved in cell wall biosynthesis